MKKTKSLIISAMIMVFALAFTACGSKSSSVEGSWSGNDNGYDVVFNFEADGQGTMQLSGIQLNITYSVDGDKITINKEHRQTSIHLRFLTSQRHLHYLTIQVKLNLKRVNNQMLII